MLILVVASFVCIVCMYVCLCFVLRFCTIHQEPEPEPFYFEGSEPEPEPPKIGRLRNSGLFKYSDDYNRKQHNCNFQYLRGVYLCYFMVIKLTNIMVKMQGHI